MRRTFVLVFTSLLALSGMLLTAAPAHAAKRTPRVTINASPEPVVAGKTVKVAGRVGTGKSGNRGRVKYYFKSHKSKKWTYKGASKSTRSGYYSKTFKQSTSGTWQVRFTGNASRRPNSSKTDYVEARKLTTIARKVFSRSGTGDYTGPPVSLRSTSAMRATIKLSCVNNWAPFVVLSWNGTPRFDYDSIWLEPKVGKASASTTQYMYPDEKRGYFRVGTQSDCSWTVTVTQSYRGYVKV